MLRRVARALRAVLLVVGAVLLVGFIASCFVSVLLTFPRPLDGGSVWLRNGTLELRIGYAGSSPPPLRLTMQVLEPSDWYSVRNAWGFEQRTYRNRIVGTFVALPLWVPAVFCLAWPVASLLLAWRRRKGRGFAVEPASDAAPPAIDPPAV